MRLALSSHPILCLAQALHLYLLRCPLAIDTPLFMCGSETPLSCYSHSFHKGIASTTEAIRGISDHLIKTLGRWFSCAYSYIHIILSQICCTQLHESCPPTPVHKIQPFFSTFHSLHSVVCILQSCLSVSMQCCPSHV